MLIDLTDMIEIDGNYLEGGGQIVRTALSLSLIAKKAVRISDIRRGREEPGLKSQHLSLIKAFSLLSNSQCEGASLGSEEITFYPGLLKARTLSIDIGTAGSITLFLQGILPALIHDGGRFRLRVRGGTDVRWSPTIDYFRDVFMPQAGRFADMKLILERRGFYPKGNGFVDLKVKKKETLKPLDLTERKALLAIRGRAFSHKDLEKNQVSERMAKSAMSHLSGFGVPVRIESEYSEADSIGCGISCYAIFSDSTGDADNSNPIRLGADILGEREVRAEEVGRLCQAKLSAQISLGGCADENLADNLIPYITLFGGKFLACRITDHTRTNIYVCEKILEKTFCIQGNLISS